MDDFMNHVVESLTKNGAQAVRVFPRDSKVLLAFAERLANEVVCILDYGWTWLFQLAQACVYRSVNMSLHFLAEPVASRTQSCFCKPPQLLSCNPGDL